MLLKIKVFILFFILFFISCGNFKVTLPSIVVTPEISCISQTNSTSANDATICLDYTISDLTLRSVIQRQCDLGDITNQLRPGTFSSKLCDSTKYKYYCLNLEAQLDNGLKYKYNLYSDDNTIKANCGLTSIDGIKQETIPGTVNTNTTVVDVVNNTIPLSGTGTLQSPKPIALNTASIDSILANYEFYYTFTAPTTRSYTLTVTPPANTDLDIFVYANTYIHTTNCNLQPTPSECIELGKIETRSIATQVLNINLTANTVYKLRIKRVSGFGSFTFVVQ